MSGHAHWTPGGGAQADLWSTSPDGRHFHLFELKVRGNRAIGRWYLQDTVHMMEHRLTLEGSAFYEDRYLRTEGGWRIAHTGYRRVVDRTIAWDDMPGMKISAPGFESPG